MEIIDSRTFVQSADLVVCDVSIIGAGAAGLYLGTQLAEAGLSVAIVESGGRISQTGADLGFNALLPKTEYRGSVEGRFFGLGGSTARWGGLIISHSRSDIRQTTGDSFDAWRHIVKTVTENQDVVAATLKIDDERRYEQVARGILGDVQTILYRSNIATLAAEFLPFRRKNLSFLLNTSRVRQTKLKVFLNGVACRWTFDSKDGTPAAVESVTVTCSGKEFRIQADRFVIAAGAIESSRILMEIDRHENRKIITGAASVGRYLSDHLSIEIGTVEDEDRRLCVKTFGPRFRKGRMRSFRFLNSKPDPNESRSFCHFIFESDNPGFVVAKKMLQSFQGRKWESLGLVEILRGGYGLFGLGYQRFILSRLYIDKNARIRLQLDVEQLPNRNNRIFLTDELDDNKRPIPRIDWEIKSGDFENIERLAEQYLISWPKFEATIPQINKSDLDSPHSNKPHDAYHPVGTCRLGTDRDSVVSPELKVHGTENMYVLSTAVFPTVGTANPTFSMLCLGQSLATKIRRELG